MKNEKLRRNSSILAEENTFYEDPWQHDAIENRKKVLATREKLRRKRKAKKKSR